MSQAQQRSPSIQPVAPIFEGLLAMTGETVRAPQQRAALNQAMCEATVSTLKAVEINYGLMTPPAFLAWLASEPGKIEALAQTQG